jgi:hypothetical protein
MQKDIDQSGESREQLHIRIMAPWDSQYIRSRPHTIVHLIGFQYVEQRSTKKNRKRRNNGKHRATLDLVTQAPLDLSQHLENRRSTMEKSQWLSLSSSEQFNQVADQERTEF